MKIAATLSANKKLSGAAINEHAITGIANNGLEISGNLSAIESITGEVAIGAALKGTAASKVSVAGNLAASYETKITAYEGDYEVTPKVDGQELKTKHKYMTDDVTVHAIPFFEVSNTSGGNTVYIANEIEFE